MLKMITLHSEYQLGYEDARLLAQYSQLIQYDIPGVIHLTANECENIFSKEFFEVFEKSGIEVDAKVIRDLMPSPPKTPLNYNDK
jgi:RNA polymerase-interacting CarD/CdnL/TRCF family regulator